VPYLCRQTTGMAIKNIIFDLGGVLLNLDFGKTAKAFQDLGVTNFNDYFTQTHANPLFKTLETGDVPSAVFYDEFRATTGLRVTDEAIAGAWNAMLLDFPKERIELLQELKKKYRLFLFSNTNAIHYDSFQETFVREFAHQFDSLFEKAYYSHIIGHRKPNVSAFEYILIDAGINAEESVFIDDTLPNVDAAQKAGIEAWHLKSPETIIELVKRKGL
jgi:putative hydrolase of the HAD superfamily